MGANAQTTVQNFVDGAVLTAAQQNTSAATGVPVFATTVTRDAAFGGANKVLAEGQLCYLESTDETQYYSGSAWLSVGPAAVTQYVKAFCYWNGTGTISIRNSFNVASLTDNGVGDNTVTYTNAVGANACLSGMGGKVGGPTSASNSSFMMLEGDGYNATGSARMATINANGALIDSDTNCLLVTNN